MKKMRWYSKHILRLGKNNKNTRQALANEMESENSRQSEPILEGDEKLPGNLLWQVKLHFQQARAFRLIVHLCALCLKRIQENAKRFLKSVIKLPSQMLIQGNLPSEINALSSLVQLLGTTALEIRLTSV